MTNTKVRTFKFLGCEVLYREACYLAATGPNVVNVEFLSKGLHDLETADMTAQLQAAIDAVDPAAGYEAILLGYARCNDGLVGVRAREIPLVLPKAHDCITLLFGSRRAFWEEFQKHPGTYYKSTGWSERDDDCQVTYPAYGKEGVMARLGLTESYEQLVAKHGKENADYVIQTLGGWEKAYNRLCYIEMGFCDEKPFLQRAKEQAQQHHWTFERRRGDLTLLRRLFLGEWDEDFIVVPPGGQIVARNDEEILGVEPS